MTEADWLGCTDPEAMLKSLRGSVSARKVRLFACHCCRRVWHLLSDPRSRAAVGVMELLADGAAGEAERRPAHAAAWAAVTEAHQAGPGRFALGNAARAAADACSHDAHAAARAVAKFTALAAAGTECRPRRQDRAHGAYPAECQAQAGLLRDLVGNPFRPVAVDPVCVAPAVTALAQAAYAERLLPGGALDPARLAVLADALEDAGCTDPDILGHFCGPGPHARGCWVVDLLLDQE